MKPIKIEMQYFGPYQNEVVDFTRFDASPLFLISGPTGAGKTTIFDAMTYALFGVGSGNRRPEAMRSDFATPADWTRVRFTFEHQNRTYVVERAPQQERFAKRGTGITNAAAEVSLIEIDPLTRTPLKLNFTKKIEVDRFIEELIALTADQFRQIILLPQAQFQKFLTADSSEKETILRDLFGTEIFLAFSERLKVQASTLAKQQATYDQQLNNLFNQVNWSKEQEVAFAATRSLAERQALLATALTTAKATLSESQAALKATERSIDVNNRALTAGKLLEKDIDQLATVTTQLATLQTQAVDFETQAKLAVKYQWVSEQGPLLDQYHQLMVDEPKLKAQLAELTTTVGTYRSQQTAQAEIAATLAKEAPTISTATATQTAILSKWLPWAQQKEQLKRKLDAATLNAKLTSDKVEQLKETDHQAQLALKVPMTELDTLPNVDVMLAQVNELKALIKQAHAEAKQLEESKATGLQLATEVTTIQADAEKLASAISAANAKLASQRERRQQLMIQQLQNELVPGEACIVCGSLEHPKATDNHQIAVTDQEIKKAIEALEEQKQVLEEQKATAKSLDKQVERLTIAIANNDATKLTLSEHLIESNTALQKFVSDHFELTGPADYDASAWEALVTELITTITKNKERAATLTAKIDNLTAVANEAATAVIAAQDKFKSYTNERAVIANDLAVITQKAPDLLSVAQYQTQLSELNEQISDYNTAVAEQQRTSQEIQLALATEEAKQASVQNQVTAQQKQLANITDQLMALLKTQPTIKDLATLTALLTEERTQHQSQQLNQAVTKYHADVEHCQGEIKRLTTQIAGQKVPDLVKLQADGDTLLAIRNQQIEVQTSQYAQVSQLENIQKQIDTIITTMGAQATQIRELSQLADAVNGKNDQRLTLERYVLQSFLMEVLSHANASYFNQLTGNRYQFYVKQEAGSRANKTGLEINIYDNDADQFRAVDTLSGGETFLASLAIALSLAEVIQNKAGGIQIEALFIDEGFGSLDQSTLTKAMETLNVLQASGRIIGIISHVESMKHEIQQQLQVIKKGNGQSHLQYQLV